jgi:hypothetical protein
VDCDDHAGGRLIEVHVRVGHVSRKLGQGDVLVAPFDFLFEEAHSVFSICIAVGRDAVDYEFVPLLVEAGGLK